MSERFQRAAWVPAAALCVLLSAPPVLATLAGGEFDSPTDSPSARLDTVGVFPFVGALSIFAGNRSYIGSAVALSSDWVLTAGHNTDFDDDGVVDADWSASLHLPGYGVYGFTEAIVHPDFTGFGSPSVHDDLALLRLADPLPDHLPYPGFGGEMEVGQVLTLAGFGRSGYGSYGYTTDATLTDRRSGQNVIDLLTLDDGGGGFYELFRYEFDPPDTAGQPGGSLGNDIETIIGPGDSGGPAMIWGYDRWQVVGINTFTEGYGGRFGDAGGGVLLAPYRDWILQTTGLLIPEPATLVLLLIGGILLRLHARRR